MGATGAVSMVWPEQGRSQIPRGIAIDADKFIAANRRVLDEDKHGWEERFVDEVLRHVPGLDFAAVRPQTPFTDGKGRSRRIDFTIAESSWVRIALEVDGYDKRGTGEGMSRAEFLDWSLREQAAVSQGWRLLRFANGLIDREPEICISSVALTLELERGLARQVAQAKAGAAEAAEALRLAEARAAQAEERLTDAERRLDAVTAAAGDRSTLEHEVARLREASDERHKALAVAVGQAARTVLSGSKGDELERVELARHASVRALEREIDELTSRFERVDKENRGMKLVAGAFAVVAVAVAVIVVALSSSGDGGSPAGERSGAGDADSPCDGALDWSDARGRVGESVRVAGPVVSTTFRGESTGKPTFLNVGRPFGDDERLVVVIWGRNRSKFPRAPEVAYDDKRVAVTGVVSQFAGVAQIEVMSPSAIERCG